MHSIPSIVRSFGVLSLALLSACLGGGGGGGGGNPAPPASSYPTNPDGIVGLFINPADPTLAQIHKPDGTTIEYRGVKDPSGVPLALTEIRVKDASDQETKIALDGNQRVDTVTAPNGTRFHFTYLGGDQVRLEATSPGGELTLSVLGEMPMPPAPPALTMSSALSLPATADATLDVTVIQCNQPQDGFQVEAFVTTQSLLQGAFDFKQFSVPCSPIGGGKYRCPFTYQTSTTAADAVETICEAVGELVSWGCFAVSLVGDHSVYWCNLLTMAAVGVAPQLAPFAAQITSACVVAIEVAQAACMYTGIDTPDGQGPGVFDFCGNIADIVDNALLDSTTIYAIASHPGNLGWGFAAVGPLEPPIGALETQIVVPVNLVEHVTVSEEENPLPPFHPYSVVAHLQCVPPGTQIVFRQVAWNSASGYTTQDQVFAGQSGDFMLTQNYSGGPHGSAHFIVVFAEPPAGTQVYGFGGTGVSFQQPPPPPSNP